MWNQNRIQANCYRNLGIGLAGAKRIQNRIQANCYGDLGTVGFRAHKEPSKTKALAKAIPIEI